jgi:hypothetical protein
MTLATLDPLWPAIVGMAGIVIGAIVTWMLARRGEAVDRRRSGYATAMDALVAYAEYPYRLRRRTSDDGATLERLAELGHDTQQALRRSEAWIAGESRKAVRIFDEVRVALQPVLGTSCNEAWNSSPVAAASEMNLDGWGPSAAIVDGQLARFKATIASRFGWRRLASSVGWMIGVPKSVPGVPTPAHVTCSLDVAEHPRNDVGGN